MSNHWKRIIVLTILSIMIPAACTGGGGSQPDLDGTAWMLTHLRGAPVLEGRQPTLYFQDGRVSGFASCNSFGGEYKQRSDLLSIGAIMSTLMACESTAVTQQEQAYLAALAETTAFQLQDGRLYLLDKDGLILLEFSPQIFLMD